VLTLWLEIGRNTARAEIAENKIDVDINKPPSEWPLPWCWVAYCTTWLRKLSERTDAITLRGPIDCKNLLLILDGVNAASSAAGMLVGAETQDGDLVLLGKRIEMIKGVMDRTKAKR
jgi:hypothetical protein